MNRIGIALLNSLFAVAILIVMPMRADAKKVSVGVDKVIGACKRTPGCHYDSSGPGLGTGCSPKVCFICENSKCFAIIKGKGPNKGATLGGIRLPPAPVRSSSGGTGAGENKKPVRHPVNVKVGNTNPPGKIKTPVAAGKSDGINHGHRH